ncbi:MAG: roadblock/LC7 domain-containing protein [Candidatus Helarchaeota archaeon]
MSIREIEHKIATILERIAGEVALNTLALISRDGRRIAYYSRTSIDPDLMSAVVAAILNAAEMAINSMGQGPLWEIVLRGQMGFTVVSCAGTNFLLIGSGSPGADLGLIVATLRDYAQLITDILGGV